MVCKRRFYYMSMQWCARNDFTIRQCYGVQETILLYVNAMVYKKRFYYTSMQRCARDDFTIRKYNGVQKTILLNANTKWCARNDFTILQCNCVQETNFLYVNAMNIYKRSAQSFWRKIIILAHLLYARNENYFIKIYSVLKFSLVLIILGPMGEGLAKHYSCQTLEDTLL